MKKFFNNHGGEYVMNVGNRNDSSDPKDDDKIRQVRKDLGFFFVYIEKKKTFRFVPVRGNPGGEVQRRHLLHQPVLPPDLPRPGQAHRRRRRREGEVAPRVASAFMLATLSIPFPSSSSTRTSPRSRRSSTASRRRRWSGWATTSPRTTSRCSAGSCAVPLPDGTLANNLTGHLKVSSRDKLFAWKHFFISAHLNVAFFFFCCCSEL